MNSSPEIKQLAVALSKAQGVMPRLVADKENPHFRSDYATLAAVIDVIRGPLSSNGLCFVQTCETSTDGKYFIETTLVHSSGEWISSRMPLLINKNDMQGFGSAWTYGCRYSLKALIGIADHKDDDDANTATSKPFSKTTQPPAPTPKPSSSLPVTAMWNKVKNQFPTTQGAREFISLMTGKTSSDDLTTSDLVKIDKALADLNSSPDNSDLRGLEP